jgi:hypothetical protein
MEVGQEDKGSSPQRTRSLERKIGIEKVGYRSGTSAGAFEHIDGGLTSDAVVGGGERAVKQYVYTSLYNE